MRHPVCALAEGAFKRAEILSHKGQEANTIALFEKKYPCVALWYRLGWWLEHRVREKYGHQDYHFPIPRPEVYECPKCKKENV